MNAILALPLEFRLATLFVVGVCLGSLANLAVYRLAWNPRSISPWSAPHPDAPARRRSDRVPILGWFGVRRESHLHGTGFWVRPMFAELLLGVGVALLYWWEIARSGLWPLPSRLSPLVISPSALQIHAEFASHLALVWMMLVASLIDSDEKVIPDTITVPGTLLGLLAAAACPWSLLPDFLPPVPAAAKEFNFLTLTSPCLWPDWLGHHPQPWSLVIGIGCWWLWCIALMRRTWYSRHGWTRAIRLSLARLQRDPSTAWLGLMGLVGSALIVAVWFMPQANWVGLLTALAGMAASGGLIWLVRIIGSATLGREAMGFGDVTLMAMIGAFLGWQSSLVIFFLAPLAGVVVGVGLWVVRRDNEIPYGPFLCLASLVLLMRWQPIWGWMGEVVVELRFLVPAIVLICLVAMAVLLAVFRLARNLFG